MKEYSIVHLPTRMITDGLRVVAAQQTIGSHEVHDRLVMPTFRHNTLLNND